MRDKPDQVSGFKRSPTTQPTMHADDDDEEDGGDWTKQLFSQFCDALKSRAPDALANGMAFLEGKGQTNKRGTSVPMSQWAALKVRGDGGALATDSASFSFGFDVGGNEDDGLTQPRLES